MPSLSARLTRTELAATFAMTARARALRAAGHDVISLSLGEPDFPTPPHVIQAAHEAALRSETKYPPIGGTEALRAAIRRKYARDQKLDVAEPNILVTNGGKQAIFNVILSVIDPATRSSSRHPPGPAMNRRCNSPAVLRSSSNARKPTAF